MKKILFVFLVIATFSFVGCFSTGVGSIGSTVGGLITGAGMGNVLTANDGKWKSQIDSNVSVQFLSTVAGRESGQNWYNGTVTKNGKTSSFIWVSSSYTDENNVHKNELYVKEGNSVGTTKPSYRYIFTQSMYAITIIFTEEGSSAGAKI